MERQQLCQFYLDEGEARNKYVRVIKGGGDWATSRQITKEDSKFKEVLACDQPGGLGEFDFKNFFCSSHAFYIISYLLHTNLRLYQFLLVHIVIHSLLLTISTRFDITQIKPSMNFFFKTMH